MQIRAILETLDEKENEIEQLHAASADSINKLNEESKKKMCDLEAKLKIQNLSSPQQPPNLNESETLKKLKNEFEKHILDLETKMKL